MTIVFRRSIQYIIQAVPLIDQNSHDLRESKWYLKKWMIHWKKHNQFQRYSEKHVFPFIFVIERRLSQCSILNDIKENISIVLDSKGVVFISTSSIFERCCTFCLQHPRMFSSVWPWISLGSRICLYWEMERNQIISLFTLSYMN